MKKWLYYLLLLFFAGFAAFAGYKLFAGLLNYKQGNDLYDGIREQVVSEKSTAAGKTAAAATGSRTDAVDDAGDDAGDDSGTDSGDEAAGFVRTSRFETEGKITHLHADIDYMIWPVYEIDFDALKDISDEVVGWIRIEDTHIDYPVVQHEDNSFYLRRGIDGNALNTGSIYVDYRVEAPFVQENTIIYGHNQRNSAMFHDLVRYAEQDFASEHPYVIVYLPDGTELTYRVFAAYETPSVSDCYSLVFADSESYFSYLLDVQGRSETDFGVSMSAEDRIITLSTCTNDFDDNRFVVQAKLISSRAVQ